MGSVLNFVRIDENIFAAIAAIVIKHKMREELQWTKDLELQRLFKNKNTLYNCFCVYKPEEDNCLIEIVSLQNVYCKGVLLEIGDNYCIMPMFPLEHN